MLEYNISLKVVVNKHLASLPVLCLYIKEIVYNQQNFTMSLKLANEQGTTISGKVAKSISKDICQKFKVGSVITLQNVGFFNNK